MKRFWPRSIAGRTTLVLIGGVLAVLWAGSMVWWLSFAAAGGPPSSRIAFESIAGIAAMVDRLPAEQRAEMMQAVTTDTLGFAWAPDGLQRRGSRAQGHGWEPRWITRHLRRSLAARGFSRVEFDFPDHRGPGTGKTISAFVRLSDAS